jgi:hypothetical protein
MQQKKPQADNHGKNIRPDYRLTYFRKEDNVMLFLML